MSTPSPRVALFAGSFDPITNGHLDVIGKAVKLADRLVLAIGIHPGKTPLFPADERLAMLTEICAPLGARCCRMRDRLRDLCRSGRQRGAPRWRGRAGAVACAMPRTSITRCRWRCMNAAMAPDIQTLIPARRSRGAPDHQPLWSGRSPGMGGDVSAFVPKERSWRG